ncbi:DUF2088 domain-containing protein [bacterium]|nr:DUF2088 domain-containing protein [bacterium]
MMTVELPYGAHSQLTWTLPPTCAARLFSGPREEIELLSTTRDCLASPLDMPPLTAALVPGDRVVLAVERNIPLLDHVIAAVWSQLSEVGIDPGDLTILQPADPSITERHDPRVKLPTEIREQVAWKIHDPTLADGCGYLASSASGDRIYLARELLDSDFILPISLAGFDAMLGYKSPCGMLYPGMSNVEAFQKTRGEGHQELSPDDERPLRQLVEEIGWLLGVQYVIQVAPSGQRGQAAEILAGGIDTVSRRARKLLTRDWKVQVPERVENVIVALPTDQQAVSWNLLGAALDAAKHLVERGGRIIVLTDLQQAPGPGVQLIREQRSAKLALQPLRSQAPQDLLAATQLAAAADWARIYLRSELDTQLVEELFCTPLGNDDEVLRLLNTLDSCVILEAAQFMHTEIADQP